MSARKSATTTQPRAKSRDCASPHQGAELVGALSAARATAVHRRLTSAPVSSERRRAPGAESSGSCAASAHRPAGPRTGPARCCYSIRAAVLYRIYAARAVERAHAGSGVKRSLRSEPAARDTGTARDAREARRAVDTQWAHRPQSQSAKQHLKAARVPRAATRPDATPDANPNANSTSDVVHESRMKSRRRRALRRRTARAARQSSSSKTFSSRSSFTCSCWFSRRSTSCDRRSRSFDILSFVFSYRTRAFDGLGRASRSRPRAYARARAARRAPA